MKNYRLYEAQDNVMNYIILTDGEGNAKHIDHDVSGDEIAELAKLFAEQDGELESRVESDWMSEDEAFSGLFAKREVESKGEDEKQKDMMSKKFALVTEYGEIDDSRNVKAVRNGTTSIYNAFDVENGTRCGSFDERLFDTLDDAKRELAKLKTIAIVRKNAVYFLDCEVSYIEERHYDEDGEYDLAECGNVWAAEEEIED